MKIDDILNDKYLKDLYQNSQPSIIGKQLEYNKWKKSLKTYNNSKHNYSLYAALDYPIVSARINNSTIGVYKYHLNDPSKCIGYITSKSDIFINKHPYILIPNTYDKLELLNLMRPYLSNIEDITYFRLKENADRMLARLISIPLYRSLSPRELAIKATKLAYELDLSVQELSKMIK